MKGEDPRLVYSDWQKLGKGSFGVVYMYSLPFIIRYRVTLNGQYYAIKVLEDNNNMLVLQREIAFQIRSQCQNIVMFYDTYLFDRKIWVFNSL